MMIGVLTDARPQSAALICVPVLAVTVVPPAPPVVARPNPIGVPEGVEGGVVVPFTVMVWARVDCVPQLLVCVAVAVQDAVGLTVCVREEPEVPQPDHDQLPPEAGNGAKATAAPELMVALAVWVPLMTAVIVVAGQEGVLFTVIV
jgi:hypothetical protein